MGRWSREGGAKTRGAPGCVWMGGRACARARVWMRARAEGACIVWGIACVSGIIISCVPIWCVHVPGFGMWSYDMTLVRGLGRARAAACAEPCAAC